MFLNILNNEEKMIFGSLVYKIAEIDGVIVKEEKELLENFRVEMKLDKMNNYDIQIEDAIEKLSNSSLVAKKAMFLELVSLVLSDEEFASEEEEMINEIASKFSLAEEKMSFINTVKELQSVYGKVFDIVFED